MLKTINEQKEKLIIKLKTRIRKKAIENVKEKINKEYEKNRLLALELGKKYKKQFDKINIAKNILDIKK